MRRRLISFVAPVPFRTPAAQSLLQLDYITYTIKPVRSYSDVADRFAQLRESMSESMRTVVLLNCGGTVDLTVPLYELKVPAAIDGDADEDATMVVIDSHRPLNLENVRADTRNVIVIDDTMDPEAVEDMVQICLTLNDREPDETLSEPDSEEEEELSGLDESARAERRRRLNDGSYATLSPTSKRGFRRRAEAHYNHYYRGNRCAHPPAATRPARRLSRCATDARSLPPSRSAASRAARASRPRRCASS